MIVSFWFHAWLFVVVFSLPFLQPVSCAVHPSSVLPWSPTNYFSDSLTSTSVEGNVLLKLMNSLIFKIIFLWNISFFSSPVVRLDRNKERLNLCPSTRPSQSTTSVATSLLYPFSLEWNPSLDSFCHSSKLLVHLLQQLHDISSNEPSSNHLPKRTKFCSLI